MTRTEAKLMKARLGDELDGGEIIIVSTTKVEIFVTDLDGDCDHNATARLKNRVSKILNWGGFKNGWGGWTLRRGYKDHAPDAGR